MLLRTVNTGLAAGVVTNWLWCVCNSTVATLQMSSTCKHNAISMTATAVTIWILIIEPMLFLIFRVRRQNRETEPLPQERSVKI